MTRICYAVCIFLFFHGQLFAQLSWERLYPLMDKHEKHAIASPSGVILIIVGAGGRIWRSSDDGLRWTDIPTPVNTTLLDVTFVTSSIGCAVGEQGVILRTSDAGKHWELIPSGTSVNWKALTTRDSVTFLAVGSKGAIQRSSDEGRTWEAHESIGEDTLRDIAFATSSLGVAVGDNAFLVVTTDGGDRWQKVIVDELAHDDLRMVGVLNDSTMLLASTYGHYSIRFDRENARVIDVVQHTRSTNSVFYTKSKQSDENRLLLAGYYSAWCQTPISPSHGMLSAFTHDGAARYHIGFASTPGVPFSPPLRDVTVTDAGSYIALAEGGIILRGDKDRTTWTSSNPGIADFYGLANRGDAAVIAYGHSAVSLESIDGGKSWYQTEERWVNSMSFSNEHTGLMLNGYLKVLDWPLLRTTNGGEWWSRATPHRLGYYMAADIHSSGFALAIDNLQNCVISTDGGKHWQEQPKFPERIHLEVSIVIINETRAYMILWDKCEVFETTDQGLTWQRTDAPLARAQGYSFLDSGIGVAVNHLFWLTRDAGATWQNMGYPPIRANAVHILDTLHVLVVGDHGRTALSRDLGRSWEESVPVTSYALQACRIIDSSRCVAVGEQGVVLVGTIDSPTSIEYRDSRVHAFALHGIYPNPFNSSTSIEFSIPQRGAVRLAIHDRFGREIAILAEGDYSAGVHVCRIDGTGLASDMYICRLVWNGSAVARKMLLVR